MKIVITGGHVTPALSVIEKLQEKIPRVEIIFLGRKQTTEEDKTLSFEYQAVSKLFAKANFASQNKGVRFVNIISGRLRRFFSWYSIVSLFKIPIGTVQSLFILLKEKPQVILSFGGYLAVPVVLSGWILRIPIVTHEQTFSAGLANKIIALLANRICVSTGDSLAHYPVQKTVVTGNPLRKEIWQVNKKSIFFQLKSFGLPIIYITGGSQGALFINQLIARNLEKLLSSYVLVHQCGNVPRLGGYQWLDNIRQSLSLKLRERYFLVPHIFFTDIGTVYNVCDLVVGRAGANTVWELYALNKRAVLIPLPFGQKQEQEKNAHFLKTQGLASVLPQESITDEEFLRQISLALKKENTVVKAKNFIKDQAGEKILQEVLNVVKQKTR